MKFTDRDLKLLTCMLNYYKAVTQNKDIAIGSNTHTFTFTPSRKQRFVSPIAGGNTPSFTGCEGTLDIEVPDKFVVPDIETFIKVITNHKSTFGDNVEVKIKNDGGIAILARDPETNDLLSNVTFGASDEMNSVPPSIANKASEGFERYTGYKYDGFEDKLKTLPYFEFILDTNVLGTALSTFDSIGDKGRQVKFVFDRNSVRLESTTKRNSAKYVMDTHVEHPSDMSFVMSPNKLSFSFLKRGEQYNTRVFYHGDEVMIIALSTVGQPTFYLTPEVQKDL